MRTVIFLPAKGESSRVENKNLKLLDGKPLFLHTLEKIASSMIFDEVYLDTDSDEIIEAASEINCKILKRDKSLASNKVDGNEIFRNQISKVEADIYIQILCTSPFITIETIHNALNKIIKSKKYDSAVLVKNEKLYTWENGEPNYNYKNIPNSVDLKNTTIETMGLYIIKKESAKKYGTRIGKKPYMIEATALESIDVNWPDDFKLAELIAAGAREKDRSLLGNIKINLNSSILSDILDEMGYKNQIIKSLKPNIETSKILGRAKTLKLRKLKKGENFKGIYEALNSYETVVPNDIILVENECPDYAYFGELNTNLAIRSGCSGVIIGGMTRDSSAVKNANLPVFSKGFSCQDVKNRVTTESINKKIRIGGVDIAPNCLIFADNEGIVVIPKSIENQVIIKANQIVANEKNILSAIASGISIDELTKKYGFF